MTASRTAIFLDEATIGEQARAETRSRERHLPPIGAYRWWARRTESVFGAFLDAYARYADNERLLVADPFAGGGVIPLAALARGHNVYAQDLNPWPIRCLAGAVQLPDSSALADGVSRVGTRLAPIVEEAYGTRTSDGSPAVVSSTIRVASCACPECGAHAHLYPFATVSLVARKETCPSSAWLACPHGHLNVGRIDGVSKCSDCGEDIDPSAEYGRRRIFKCPRCGAESALSAWMLGDRHWQPVLVQRVGPHGWELREPTAREVEQAEAGRGESGPLGEIRMGRETRVLRNHGFLDWADIYPSRQRRVMTCLMEAIEAEDLAESVRSGLRLAAWGIAEMAGYLSRWDRWYLKPYEAMAGHRFNLTTLPCEINVWGAYGTGRGSFSRRTLAVARAAEWFQSQDTDSLDVRGPEPGAHSTTPGDSTRYFELREGDSAMMSLASGVVDLVLTDPPFHDDVQYDELSLPLRVWADMPTDRLVAEAVAGGGGSQGGCEYREALSQVFRECRRVLKTNGHMALSFSNRNPHAWADCLAALQSAGFRPCGSLVVHSENEFDHVKRGRRAGLLNLLMILTPESSQSDLQVLSHAARDDVTAEHEFLSVAAKYFDRLGTLNGSWENDLRAELAACEYVTPASGNVRTRIVDRGSVGPVGPSRGMRPPTDSGVSPEQRLDPAVLRVAAQA